MKKVTLNIENLNQSLSVTLDEELSIGRTNLAQVVLDDEGLSRINTTIFRDGDEILIVDENSTNGTFINGHQITGAPKPLNDGDEITIGNNTRIFIEIRDAQSGYEPMSTVVTPSVKPKASKVTPAAPLKPQQKKPLPLVLIGSVVFSVMVISGALVAILFISPPDNPSNSKGSPTPPPFRSDLAIPIRVTDPLGGEDPDDIDDILSSWEVEDKAADIADLGEIKATTTTGIIPAEDYNVTREFWKAQQDLAMQAPSGPTGIRPPGLNPPSELAGDGVIKQKLKLAEMKKTGYQQPLDFADLARERLAGRLLELPLATKTFLLEVGSNATDAEFTEFVWSGNTPTSVTLQPGSPKYQILKKLADDFSGQKYDLNNPSDRKQMKIRLLRMFNPLAKDKLYKIATAFEQQFHKPLRVTSLTRSMEYQISLNKSNANSFKVRDAESLPPHTSGCAFDLARKHMSADEQNFLMQFLAKMEDNNEIDSLIEYNDNACFHNFIYFDGKPPVFGRK
jgi:pSer/pThr/pTyr-binding forkhead associated (FHA) protein